MITTFQSLSATKSKEPKGSFLLGGEKNICSFQKPLTNQPFCAIINTERKREGEKMKTFNEKKQLAKMQKRLAKEQKKQAARLTKEIEQQRALMTQIKW